MNSYWFKSGKVMYGHPDAGYPYDQELARKHLVKGKIYHVVNEDIGRNRSEVLLRGISGVWFNSVMFEEVK